MHRFIIAGLCLLNTQLLAVAQGDDVVIRFETGEHSHCISEAGAHTVTDRQVVVPAEGGSVVTSPSMTDENAAHITTCGTPGAKTHREISAEGLPNASRASSQMVTPSTLSETEPAQTRQALHPASHPAEPETDRSAHPDETRSKKGLFSWLSGGSESPDSENESKPSPKPAINPKAEHGDFALFVEILSPIGENRYSVNHGMAGVIDADNGLCRSATASHFLSANAELYVSPWASSHTSARVPAKVIHQSEAHDFAVIEHPCALRSGGPIRFSRTNPNLRTKLFAFGQPVPKRGVVAEGIVAGYWHLPEHTHAPAMISSLLAVEGFSGGPVYDLKGRYVGMIFGRSSSLEGYSYILPVETIHSELLIAGH